MASKGEQTRERILQEAQKVFNRKGFRATTITDLLEATGATKGNLYFHFTGKADVWMEVLNREKLAFAKFLNEVLSDQNPGTALDQFFRAAFMKHFQAGFVGGCLFGNTALEVSDTDPDFCHIVSEVFADWIDKLKDKITAAQRLGQVRQDLPAGHLAELVVATIEGGIMQARLNKDDGPLARVLKSMCVLLELKPASR